MSQTRYIQLLLGLVGILLLAGCREDSIEPAENEGSKESTMELMALSTSFLDIQRMDTRADYPDPASGYVPFNTLYPTTTPINRTIGVFMTPVKTTSVGNFIYEEGNIWKSTNSVIQDQTYYIYGFMPREGVNNVNAHISPLPGANTSGEDAGYAEGAVLTIQNYNALTPTDVCVIVGVRKADDTETRETGPLSPVPVGQFEYVGGPKGKNSIFVLLNHIYAGLHFKAHIDHDYHQLRNIRIKKVELVANNITELVNLNVTITANNTSSDPITSISYTPVGSPASSSTITLFPFEGGPEEVELQETSPESFLGCFVPNSCNDFVLRTTYDVYDNNVPQNLIRKGCVAENQINSHQITNMENMQAGDIITLDLLVKPTYLYMLSEPDLNNPTITLTATP